MSNLSDEFKKLIFKKGLPDENLLLPLLRWSSGYRKNIGVCQKINLRIFRIPKELNTRTLYNNNTVRRFIKYPKSYKKDKDLEFFYKDIARYYGWTPNELQKNINILDLEELKPLMAKCFGYDDTKRKKLKLKTIKQLINNVAKKNKRSTT